MYIEYSRLHARFYMWSVLEVLEKLAKRYDTRVEQWDKYVK